LHNKFVAREWTVLADGAEQATPVPANTVTPFTVPLPAADPVTSLLHSAARSMPVELSVILVVGERRDRAAGALLSLLSQDAVERMEILFFDLAPGEPPPLPGSDHPAVRRLRLPADTLFSAAKAEGVRRAAGRGAVLSL
jgi:hypothetical protein